MKTLTLTQGSQEWLEARRQHHTASEASAMMGMSKYQSRSELLRVKATGLTEEVSSHTQRLFDRGHETEALARAIAEEIIGDELFPATVTDDEGYLLASLDGMTMMGDVIWEHKLANADLIADVQAGRCPECHFWQVTQALHITKADKCLFMVSDGTKENCHHVWVTLGENYSRDLVSGWKQFDADLAAYVPEAPKVEVIGRAPDELPALHIEVTGMVTASNLDSFKSNAIAVIQGINRDLSTDTDFANAEKTVKWLGGVEDKLKAAKEHALSQTQSIDALFKAIDSIGAEARATRLELEKLVKARKDGIRIEIQQAAQQALFDHMAGLNKRLGGKVAMPNILADFAGVMKGKKTVTSLQDAVDTELARVKIESSAIADKIEINLNSLRELAGNHAFLFSDAQQLVSKANDDLVLLINARIADHEAKEAARIEAEVQRKLAVEREAEAAAVRKAESDRLRAEAVEREARLQAEAKQRQAEADVQKEPAPVAQKVIDLAPSEFVIAKPSRPSNEQIVMLVANHFGVDESVACEWLMNFNEQTQAA